ncbi:N-acetylmuramoyl-L-alanine amidase [Virgibacillus profundi]|uniref:N-acetylmuramoyl-L-alanine amidase n=1 Tax=Virgibacillus profundi TaxID=2024555 RepID=A0A2A2IK16_9BACI|nr:N-acetylmuramoyl-L-alanine amidase [Virgibacillus profundi]PAV31500.1 N-acetylmuramoyl-L-alanine amidase [Virgibacillus profundi]PXY55686.1 N-acetylmuramoyl-L-alanine amidase [Virgibacillus profundi]
MRKIRHFSIFIGFLLFLFLFIPSASHAESKDTYEVGTSILNVRAEPANNSSIIGLLSEGDQVVVFQEKYGWVQTYYGGEEAWIAKHHLVPVSITEKSSHSVSQAASGKITVSARSVNVRSGPGTDYSIIGSTYSGDTYNLVESSGEWHKVSLANGSTGWIAGWLTNSSDTEEVPSNTNSDNVVNVPTKQTTDKSLAGYNIVLDPGHGGKDPGAIGLGGIYEKDVITSTTGKVAEQLRNAGATVIVTRSGDYFVSLNERVRINNVYNTHAFVSLHYNAYPIIAVNGVSTYYSSESDQNLARDVQASLASTVNMYDRGVMQADYRVLRYSNAPSILMELGFITNPNDLSIVQTADYQSKVAQAVTNGLINYFH